MPCNVVRGLTLYKPCFIYTMFLVSMFKNDWILSIYGQLSNLENPFSYFLLFLNILYNIICFLYQTKKSFFLIKYLSFLFSFLNYSLSLRYIKIRSKSFVLWAFGKYTTFGTLGALVSFVSFYSDIIRISLC